MSRDRRKHLRTPMTAKLLITHETLGEKIFLTRDISDSGVFVEVNDPEWLPAVGDRVRVQVQDMPVPAPIRAMKVVRYAEDGIGMQLVDEDDDE
ncbi:PilZ domain-containing protein [Tamilnaduibacter salinus]|nr:PilZ domain-containing protein [Tamilnaduibacter salinus]PVY75305.1 PilZ domain-containing protein [Tamilnaduibacter salinus]